MKHAKGGGFLVKVDRWAPVGLPLGRAMIWSGALGAAKGFGALVAQYAPIDRIVPAQYEAPIAQTLFAVLVRLGFVKRFIGENLSSVLSVASMVAAVDGVLPIGAMIGSLVTPPAKAYVAASATVAATPAPAAAGGLLSTVMNWFSFLNPARAAQAIVASTEGTSGIGDVDTLIPVGSGYDQFQGMGAALLTSAESKLAAIAG